MSEALTNETLRNIARGETLRFGEAARLAGEVLDLRAGLAAAAAKVDLTDRTGDIADALAAEILRLDELAGKVLWHATDGRLSKTGYTYEQVAAEIDDATGRVVEVETAALRVRVAKLEARKPTRDAAESLAETDLLVAAAEDAFCEHNLSCDDQDSCETCELLLRAEDDAMQNREGARAAYRAAREAEKGAKP